MANYSCAIRTNYFRVSDEDAFIALMKNVESEDKVSVFTRQDHHGVKQYGFGCYGQIYGVRYKPEDPNSEVNYDEFISCLAQCVAEDDAILIFESGNEKLRYVVGSAIIITRNEQHYISMTDLAGKMAGTLLKNPNYSTICCF